MADGTGIEWTDATWNIVTGCTLVSEGCRHCYAARLAATRLNSHPSRAGLARLNAAGEAKFTGEVRFNEQWLDQPLRWKRPRRIFVCAHGDLFHENVPDEWIVKVFAVMARAAHHTFQVLTKRPERARAFLCNGSRIEEVGWHAEWTRGWTRGWHTWPLRNVWIGTSVEDQATANDRVPHLLAAPAAIRFVSYEPALGPIDFRNIVPADRYEIDALNGFDYDQGGVRNHLDWIISGGESGPGSRPAHPDWFRAVRDACAATGVAFLHKQNGAWQVVYDRDHDDPDWRRCDGTARQTPTGRWLNLAGGHGFHGDRVLRVIPVGKKAAGRLLDGVEHNGFPA